MAVLEADPTPLYHQIKEIIRSQIKSGELRPGDQLPTESQLVKEYGVSLITVRHALKDLVNEGLLYRRRGKGTYLATRSDEQSFVRLRCLVEDVANKGVSLSSRTLAVQTEPADADVAARLAMPVGAEIVCISRLRCVNAEPISVDVAFFPPAIGHWVATRNLDAQTIARALEDDFHLPVEEADYTVQACRADQTLSELLLVALDEPILLVERLSRGADGKPIDLQRRYYRSDRFKYELTVKRFH
ncbi:MAG: GntR family transcriptional regulator [Chloroflexi bacterium]|nr:GntR family transcriptional regulator [Chloroflexota bacterium]MDA8188553.1 GntR family transcriptional regulator [Dehalococcoidales bacterium]